MLSSPDADLVRRAPALPGLGTVLAPARFVAALRAARPELEIEAVQVGYVHYKPGRECIVGYRLPRSERAPEPSEPVTLRGTLDLYAVAQRRERWERKHPAAGHAPGDGHRRVSLAHEAVTGALFPADLTPRTPGPPFGAGARTRLPPAPPPRRPRPPAPPRGRWSARRSPPSTPSRRMACRAWRARRRRGSCAPGRRSLRTHFHRWPNGPRFSRTGSPPASETPLRQSIRSTATSMPSRSCWTAAGWASSTSTRRRAAIPRSIWGGSSLTSSVPLCGTVSRLGTSRTSPQPSSTATRPP